VEIDLAELDGLAVGVLETGMAPAVAVALTTPEATLTARTYGAASPAAPWPIGSIGKSFTAVIALQLADEGLLDLQAPVTDYLSWLSLRSRLPVTTHHLLTQSAGVVESSDLAPASTYDVIALAGTEPGFSPGEHRHYSNIGYRAVGVLLEAVTGRPYEELVERRVLDRLGLESSHAVMVHDTRRLLAGGNVPFYDDRPWQADHGLAPAPWVESAEADGCLCCTAEDLAAYLRELWTGGELLSPPSLAAMKQAQAPHEGEDAGYGYGLEIHADGFGHSGDMLGYVAHMRADTATGLGVVAFANGLGGAWYLGEAALAIAAGPRAPGARHDALPAARRRRHLPAGMEAVSGSLSLAQPLASELLDRLPRGRPGRGNRVAQRQRQVPADAARRRALSRGRAGLVARVDALRHRHGGSRAAGRVLGHPLLPGLHRLT